ncbi:MAG: DUF1571 domain-containing protein, partial [Planctomycetaceae bacterium]
MLLEFAGDGVMAATEGFAAGWSRRRVFMGAAAAVGASFVAGLGGAGAFDEKASEHPLQPALRLAREAHRRVLQMSGYECIFAKKEVVDDDLISQKMKLKIRHEPFSVY